MLKVWCLKGQTSMLYGEMGRYTMLKGGIGREIVTEIPAETYTRAVSRFAAMKENPLTWYM